MDIIFINPGNNETSDPHRKIYMEKYKKSYKNNKSNKPASTLSEDFELPNGSYSVLDIQNHFEYIIKKLETLTENSLIRIYVNKIENSITFGIQIGHYLKLLIPETMKLLGSNKTQINKNKNGENVPHLEITVVVLVHCNILVTFKSCIHLFPINPLVNYLIFPLKTLLIKTTKEKRQSSNYFSY